MAGTTSAVGIRGVIAHYRVPAGALRDVFGL
jgi:hypothetical protein